MIDPHIQANIKAFTEGDAQDSVQSRAESKKPLEQGGAGGFMEWGAFALSVPNIIEMPPWGTRQRDIFLRNVLHTATIFSAVAYGETARVKNADYILTSEDEDEDRLADFQDMLQRSDFGNGFAVLRSKWANDYLTQDNGAFIELIGKDGNRDTETPLGEVESFAYLDAMQCWRTFSPEWPVIYTNPFTGEFRVMHWTRIVMSSNYPQGIELARGMGLCALSRAYEAGRMALSTNTYLYEKVTGGSPDIHISNIPFASMQGALLSAALENDNSDMGVFKDPVVLSPRSGGVGAAELNIATLSLKSMPDGFDHKTEMDLAVFMVAAGFGVDAREYWPASTTGASKADAEIQDIKSQSKGIADVLKTLEDNLNWRILPPDITFRFNNANPVTQQREAETSLTRARTRQIQMLSGELSIDEARLMAAEEGDIDPSFLENVSITDEQTDIDETSSVEETSAEQPDETDEEEETKTLKKKSKSYNSQVRSPFLSSITSILESVGFTFGKAVRVQDLFFTFGQAAYLAGIQDGGAKGITSVNQLEPDERGEMITLLNIGTVRAPQMVEDLENATPEQINGRLFLWANKGLDSLYNAGLLRGSSNSGFIWEIGTTEKSCKDCLRLDKRVYRLKTWRKWGIEPRSSDLECGGWACDCTLTKSEERILPGRPPKITGQKQVTIT